MAEPETPPSSYAEPLLALLLSNPRLHDSIQREGGMTNVRHCYLDERFTEAALKATWGREAIEDVLNTAHARVMRPPLADEYVTLLLHQAALHLQHGHLDISREALLSHVSRNWQVEIMQVIRHGKENSVWSLRLVEGIEVKLGTSEDLLKQSKVRAAIFDVTGKVIPKMTGKESAEWDHYIELLAAVAMTVDTPELARKGYVLGLLHQYLDQQRCVLTREASDEEWEALALARKPFVREAGLYVNAPHFQHFCHMLAPELTRAALLDLLRHIGGVSLKINCWSQPPRTSRSYWRVSPLSRLEDETPLQSMPAGSVNGRDGGLSQEPEHLLQNSV